MCRVGGRIEVDEGTRRGRSASGMFGVARLAQKSSASSAPCLEDVIIDPDEVGFGVLPGFVRETVYSEVCVFPLDGLAKSGSREP